MSNVLRRLFHRNAVRDARDAAEHKPCESAEALVALGPQPPQPANDSRPPEPANDQAPATEPVPVQPPSEEDALEQQIAALLSAWDKTSLSARRRFLTRIDQRIMTAHLSRSVARDPAGDGAATIAQDRVAVVPAMAVPAASP
jgi:hypothetical protein